MLLKRIFGAGLLAGLMFGGGVLMAQDATPAATAEPAATVEAETTAEATIDVGELSQQVSLGGLVVNAPEAWTVLQGQEGDVVVSNVDLYNVDPNSPFPPDTVLIQINLYNTSQLPPEVGAVETAKDILERVPSSQEKPPVTEVQVGDVTLARMPATNPQGGETYLYAVLVNQDTFIFAVAATITPGTLAKYANGIEQVLAHLELDASAPVADDAMTKFADVPQSTSPEGFPQLGNPDAPVKIQEIASFACPACRSFQDFAMPLLMERIKAGDVLFEYVPYIGTGHIANNEQATNAALCAGEQGKFWEYHDALFAWQDFGTTAFLTERLTAGAESLGLDKDKFATCLTDEHTGKIIEAAVTYGNSLAGFVGTPTVLLNGTIVNWNPDEMNAAIDAIINAPQATAEATSEATADATAAATSEAATEPTAEATSAP